MATGDVTKKVISKWARTQVINANGQRELLKQIVYKTEAGKNRKGKVVFKSQTKHERV